MSFIPLTDLKARESGKVIEITGGPDLESRLNSMGIIKGKIITKITRQFLFGPIVVGIDKTRLALGHGFAKKILVERVK